MRDRLAFVLVSALLTAGLAACGHKIGDSCSVSSDCAEDGSRVCDSFSPKGGYCTIAGCDFGTCPSEAECIRFFPGLASTQTCATSVDCAIDEVCTVAGTCAPRSIEQRFCMLICSGDGDCRDGYECRGLDLMKKHGGEPVPDPQSPSATPPTTSFCAARRTCVFNTDCDTNETCDFVTRTCLPK